MIQSKYSSSILHYKIVMFVKIVAVERKSRIPQITCESFTRAASRAILAYYRTSVLFCVKARESCTRAASQAILAKIWGKKEKPRTKLRSFEIINSHRRPLGKSHRTSRNSAKSTDSTSYTSPCLRCHRCAALRPPFFSGSIVKKANLASSKHARAASKSILV